MSTRPRGSQPWRLSESPGRLLENTHVWASPRSIEYIFENGARAGALGKSSVKAKVWPRPRRSPDFLFMQMGKLRL